MTYRITLTDTDVATLEWVAGRYSWGNFPVLEAGEWSIPEHESWQWKHDVDSDADGGHCIFPCLDLDSDTGQRLLALYESIV